MHLSTLRRGPGPSAAEPAPTLKSIRAATIPVLGRITWSCPVKNHCLHLITFDSQQDKSEPLIYPPTPSGDICSDNHRSHEAADDENECFHVLVPSNYQSNAVSDV